MNEEKHYESHLDIINKDRLSSAVGNVYGNRCESDCRSWNASSIHTFVKIDREIIPADIHLPSTE